jgi:hypothetical protein
MNPKAKIALENAVASGKGIVTYHGVHPEFTDGKLLSAWPDSCGDMMHSMETIMISMSV